MEKASLFFAVVALGLGCDAVDRGGQTDDNRALVLRAHAEVWSGGDMAAADEIYAVDFVGHWTGRPDTHGREELKAFVRETRARFPNWSETVEQVVAEDNVVVTRFTSRGTIYGEPSHGKTVTMQEIAIHRIAGGQIVEQWTVADILGMQQQLGIIDAPTDDSVSEQ